MTTVLGIDPAMRSLAVVGADFTEKITVKKGPRARELYEMHNQLFDLIEVRCPHGERLVLFIEGPIVAGARNIQTTIKIAMTVGMVHALGYETEVVAVDSWKKEICGKGGVNKDFVAGWLSQYNSVYSDRCGGDQDLADATCIYLYGLRTLGIAGPSPGG